MSRKAFYLDLFERTVWTAIQAALAVLIETGLDDFKGWAVVRNAAILAVIKALAVNKLPWTARNSASTLPQEVDPPNEGGHFDPGMIALLIVVFIAGFLVGRF